MFLSTCEKFTSYFGLFWSISIFFLSDLSSCLHTSEKHHIQQRCVHILGEIFLHFLSLFNALQSGIICTWNNLLISSHSIRPIGWTLFDSDSCSFFAWYNLFVLPDLIRTSLFSRSYFDSLIFPKYFSWDLILFSFPSLFHGYLCSGQLSFFHHILIILNLSFFFFLLQFDFFYNTIKNSLIWETAQD